ncbi:MAG: hypothetical protein R2708_26515 [Vicinamibacterales bacterium]
MRGASSRRMASARRRPVQAPPRSSPGSCRTRPGHGVEFARLLGAAEEDELVAGLKAGVWRGIELHVSFLPPDGDDDYAETLAEFRIADALPDQRAAGTEADLLRREVGYDWYRDAKS